MNENQPPVTLNITTPTGELPAGAIAPYQDSNGQLGFSTQMKLELNQDHLTSIAVAEAERQIRVRLADLQSQMAAIRRRKSDTAASIDRYLKSWCSEQAALAPNRVKLAALESAITTFYPQTSISYGPATLSERTRQLSADYTLVDLQGRNVSFTYTFTDGPSASYVEWSAEIESLTKEEEALSKQILSARAALNNVDTIERQARAGLATQLAERTGESGQKIVAAIKASVNADNLIEFLGQ